MCKFFKKKKINKSHPSSGWFCCEIETPQFCGSEKKFWMKKQKGVFSKNELKFYPFSYLNGHEVQFSSMKDFEESLIRIL